MNDIIYGIRPIIEVINAGKEISKIFLDKNRFNNNKDSEVKSSYKELILLAKKDNIPISNVPREKLNRITKKNHQGVIAIVSPIHYANLTNIIDSKFSRGKSPTLLILDNITDTRNMGAIIRTCSCLAVDAIVIPLKEGATITSDTMKASAGALNYVSVCRVKSIINTLKYIKDCGLEILALSEKADDILYDLDLNKPLAIILGSEEKGIDPKHIKESTIKAKIPIIGPVSSLNVASAAAIACYEVKRQQIK